MKLPISYGRLILIAVAVVAVAAVTVAGIWSFRGKEAPAPAAAPKKESLTVFLPTDGGTLMRKMVAMKEGISEREKADIIMRELRKGNAVPDTTALHEFSVDPEGVLYLNLSRDLKEAQMDGTDEITTVYSLVNSFLANMKEAKKAQILVEGQAYHTLAGVVYTYAPLEFNNELVEE